MRDIDDPSVPQAALAVSRTMSLTSQPSHPQRVDSLEVGDERRGSGTAGWFLGTNGAHALRASAAFVLLTALVCSVNALSILHDAARTGAGIAPWRPWATEFTSFAGSVVALPVAIAAERLARPPRLSVRGLLVLIAGAALFSFIHVMTMVALRDLIWWSVGLSYDFAFRSDWFYEFRKDVLSFGVAVGLLAIARRMMLRPAIATPVPTLVRLPNGNATTEIDIESLNAVRGGGNYVELLFVGRPARLLRATLDAAEAALLGHGFRRTHKSWIVRLAAIEAFERTAAGDYMLRLPGRPDVPLSRRHRDVLEEIRRQLA